MTCECVCGSRQRKGRGAVERGTRYERDMAARRAKQVATDTRARCQIPRIFTYVIRPTRLYMQARPHLHFNAPSQGNRAEITLGQIKPRKRFLK